MPSGRSSGTQPPAVAAVRGSRLALAGPGPAASTVEETAASNPVLWSLIAAFTLAGLIAVPALVYLLALTERDDLQESGSAAGGSTQQLMEQLKRSGAAAPGGSASSR